MSFLHDTDPHARLLQAVILQAAEDLGARNVPRADRISARHLLGDLGLSVKEINQAAMVMHEARKGRRRTP